MDALTARKTWRTLEPLHGMIYFAPEAQERYAALGLHGRSGYFASRSAPMGAVASEVVVATFYNFDPRLVHDAMRGVWTTTTPELVVAARLDAADAALRRGLGDLIGHPDLATVARLARTVAVAACDHPDGRALFAGHASLPWPDESSPHLVLWHAQTLLREFRGDGHVIALAAEGVSGLEALVLHHATGELPIAALQGTRAWSDAAWAAATDGLAQRGLVHADGSFTDEGRALRASIEDRTDHLAMAPYSALGIEGCDRLRELGRPFARAVVAGGLVDFGQLLRSDPPTD